MVPHLAESDTREERQGLRHHLQSCPACRAEADGLIQTWNALGALPDDEVPAGVWDRMIQAQLPVPLKPVAQKYPWAAASAMAAVGVLVSVATSLFLPYERAARLCAEALRGLLAASLPDPATFLAVGFLYSLLPLGLAALGGARWLSSAAGHPGLRMGLLFGLIALPYVLIACAGLPVAFTTALVAGTFLGAIAGGGAGLWVGGRFLAPAGT
jgi:hypothetical protein